MIEFQILITQTTKHLEQGASNFLNGATLKTREMENIVLVEINLNEGCEGLTVNNILGEWETKFTSLKNVFHCLKLIRLTP